MPSDPHFYALVIVLLLILTAPWWDAMLHRSTPTTKTQGRFLENYFWAPCPSCDHVQVIRRKEPTDRQLIGTCATCGGPIISEIRTEDKQIA